MVYKVLFFITDGKVASYILEDNHYEICPCNGEYYYDLSQNGFWDWWSEIISIIKAKDQFDVCILTDDKTSLDKFYNSDYQTVSENSWTVSEITDFLKNQLPLIVNECNYKIKINATERNFQLNKSESDYTEYFISLLPFKELADESLTIESEKPIEVEKGNETDLVKYFRNITKSYNKNN